MRNDYCPSDFWVEKHRNYTVLHKGQNKIYIERRGDYEIVKKGCDVLWFDKEGRRVQQALVFPVSLPDAN